MKIHLSVNWNISKCKLNAQGLFTEIRIPYIVQCPFSGHSVPLNAVEWQAHVCDHSDFFLFLGEQIPKKHHQIGGFKVLKYYYGLQCMK